MADKYLKIIDRVNRIFNEDGIKLDAHLNEVGDLKIGGIIFTGKNLNEIKENEGLVLTQASEELRNTLEKRGISFIDGEGNLFLNTRHGQIKLRPEKMKIGYAVSYVNLGKVSVPNPTNLISPIGLSLIDTLFRIKDAEIEKVESVLKFCKLYNLSQPKISLTMKRLRAKSLIELKQRIRDIPLEWWLFGFESPSTRRKMINFFDVATPYHSLKESVISQFSNPVHEIETNFQGTAPGPTEVAKKFDLIIDRDISLWVSTEIDSKLKREFKLVPGVKEGYRTWMIATISEDILKDSVLTHHLESEYTFKTNIIRTIWDLSYGESRLREVREKMLRKFIYES